MPSAWTWANTSANVRSRRSVRLGTTHPRSARSVRISLTALVTVERSTPNSSPRTACGRSYRKWMSAATSRPTKTS